MLSTELKLWSFQVVVVQDGREMWRLAWLHAQGSRFAHWNYHVFDPLLVWLGCASKLSARWSARAVKPPGDCGRSNIKTVFIFLEVWRLVRARFTGFATHACATSIFFFLLATPKPTPATLATALQAITAIRWTRYQAKHGRACRSTPGVTCGICVSLVKFLIGRESGIKFFCQS